MNRIDATFAALKASGRKGLVGYMTAGDPDADTSYRDLRSAVDGGVDVLELGVPFSDPTADGPTIQAAALRALAGGMTVAGCLDLVRRLRRDVSVPIVLFGYANPFFRYGYETLCAEAADAGVDGMLVVDLPFEESAELRAPMDAHGLALIPLIAPTTPGERAAAILKQARGFVYYIMVTGVTGARSSVAGDIAAHTAALRARTDLPIAAGFGVSDGAQARRAAEAADAVVVGSALVKAAREGTLKALVKELRTALDETE
jgi:tryptophan synthase alpha chain